jgi:hypothetical protein
MATSGASRRGLVASRTLEGEPPNRTKLYPTLGGNAAAVYKGDLVFLDTTGRIQVFTGTSAAAPAPIGVVAAIYNSNKRPFTHNLPSTPLNIPVSTAGFAAVHDDPDTVFVIEADASLQPQDVGKYATVSAGPANTAAGTSGMVLVYTEVTGTSVGHPLTIVGLAPNELDELGGTSNDVEVVISNHHFRKNRARNVQP